MNESIIYKNSDQIKKKNHDMELGSSHTHRTTCNMHTKCIYASDVCRASIMQRASIGNKTCIACVYVSDHTLCNFCPILSPAEVTNTIRPRINMRLLITDTFVSDMMTHYAAMAQTLRLFDFRIIPTLDAT